MAGHVAYFAGGCVRDQLLGIVPKDYDIATSAPLSAVQQLFDKTIPVGEAFGVCLVLLDGRSFEVATFRKDGPYKDGRRPSFVEFTDAEEDAQRRDFTVNALFLDPETNQVLDYVGGEADLARGVLRTVGDPAERFQEDYLRLIRAIRFSTCLGFEMDAQTRAAIKPLAPQIQGISAERIGEEFSKIITGPLPAQAIRLLDEVGLLQEILPEVKAMQGVEQPPEYHPEGDVYVHTLLLLEQLDNPTLSLAMATLLHDVGKPPSQTFEDRIRFNGHDRLGAQMAETICQRFRFSNKTTEEVCWLINQHMRLGALPQMKEAKRKRLVRSSGFDELLALGLMDCKASHNDCSTIRWILEYLVEIETKCTHPPRLVTGEDLISMGYQPGPAFKTMLMKLEDAQLEGQVKTEEEARTFVEKHWPPPGK